MKTTILIGYDETDASGNPLGAPRVISGPPADESEARAQGKLFSDAKQLHKFPKGVKHLAFCHCEVADCAAHINDDLGKQIEARHKNRAAQATEQLEIIATKNREQKDLAEAQKNLSAAAVAHNAASAALNVAKKRLLDAEANYKATKTDSHKNELEAAKQKVADASAAVKTADEKLQAAKKAKADLLSTKK